MCTCMILTLAEVAPKKLMSLLQCFSFKNNRFTCFTKKKQEKHKYELLRLKTGNSNTSCCI